MPYGGGHNVVREAPEFRATTFQACGLWPFTQAAPPPLIGVPLGEHMTAGGMVCSDPASYFAEAGVIPNPSVMVMGRPGLGKSSLMRRMALGLTAFGTLPFVYGDLKPDYVQLIRALDGNVIEIGHGRGNLNVLDSRWAVQVASRLAARGLDNEAEAVRQESRARRLNTVSMLLRINRGVAPSDHEEAVLATAIRLLDERGDGTSTLTELAELVYRGDPALDHVTLSEGSAERYRHSTHNLVRSLSALLEGAFGKVFVGTGGPMIDVTRPLCMDVSSVPESDLKLSAGVLVACWSAGFGAMEAYNALVDNELAPTQNWLVILDELWRVLRAGSGMEDRADALTRIDRNSGLATAMITHNVDDGNGGVASLAKRAGYYIFGGQSPDEVPNLARFAPLTAAEMATIRSWSTPDTYDRNAGRRRVDPPGVGSFLIKIGALTGVPVKVRLTDEERRLGDTNFRWEAASWKGSAAS